ncbi:DUF4870 domain-containing protein [Brachybacterium massiliense]|uniref:DUF4870 domain-containing protein n=1 Tax=Brachybacterium massiliense TaxID=1755098 RepID=UPI000B3BBCCF|nr:DUF4870 domain-containing protein [Brachybacterium massiliense]
MSQTPPPNDPYGTEPGAPAPHGAEPGSPTSDPALHPHDPFAYDDSTRQAPAPQAQQPPAPQPSAPQPSAGTYDAPAGGYAAPGAAGASAQSGHSPYGAPHTAPAGDGPDQPAPGTKGVYEGPLSGQPLSRSDSRMWALFSQLAVVLGHVVSWGFLGWVGPLIIFMMYKDRDRFVRFHAAEALNGAIAVVIAQIVLGILITIFGVVTLGFGFALYPLVGLPALVQLIFSIIGAVKANQGEYWAYPVNIRLVK